MHNGEAFDAYIAGRSNKVRVKFYNQDDNEKKEEPAMIHSDGGVNLEQQVVAIPFNTSDEGVDYPAKAKHFVLSSVNKRALIEQTETITMEDVYVVSFAYILGDWKAMVSTSKSDGRYYEVTHNATKKETYVDTYVKVSNEVF